MRRPPVYDWVWLPAPDTADPLLAPGVLALQVDATVVATGKLWWPHTEALIALTFAYARTQDEKWLPWLRKVHDYRCETRHYDTPQHTLTVGTAPATLA